MSTVGFPLLSLLTFLPLVGALMIMMLRGEEGIVFSYSRWIALWTSLFVFVLSLVLWFRFDVSVAGLQFVDRQAWLPEFGIGYKMGVDGISVLFVLLSTLLTPICILASWTSIKQRVRQYMAAFLVLETMMVGMFSAADFVVFYMFFEAVLIPMYLIIGIWGGQRRVYAAIKFFLYTLAGSVLMLLALLAMWYRAGTTDIAVLMHTPFPAHLQTWLFLAFLASFAVKLPMWPVHTWLPDAYAEAPTAGTMMLAAVLGKMGAYGFLRFAVPMLPIASAKFAPLIFALSVVAVVYTAAVALVQKDMKRLVAYSSVSHMGLVTIGIFTFNQQGIQGALFQMVAHGIIIGALFMCLGALFERGRSQDIGSYGGLARRMPVFAAIMMVFTIANIGLPGTAGFVGEFLVMLGSFRISVWLALLGGLGMVLGVVYMLFLYRRVAFGALREPKGMRMFDLSMREMAAFAPLVILAVWMGIYPSSFTRFFDASVGAMVQQHQAALAIDNHAKVAEAGAAQTAGSLLR